MSQKVPGPSIKFQKGQPPENTPFQKQNSPAPPKYQGEEGGPWGVHTLLPPFNIQNIYPLLTLTVTPVELCFTWN